MSNYYAHAAANAAKTNTIDIRQVYEIVHCQSALKLSDFHIATTSIGSLRYAGLLLHYPTDHSNLCNNFSFTKLLDGEQFKYRVYRTLYLNIKDLP